MVVVIAGPSGVGKGTLIAKLVEAHAGRLGLVVSHTTRGPRRGEEDVVHYHFTAADVMEGMVAAAEFLEHAEVHGPLRNPRPRILVQSLDRLTYYGICL